MVPTSEQELALLDAVRLAESPAERRFVLLNRTRDALPFQAAALLHDNVLAGHSGTSQADPHGPYVQWLVRLARTLSDRSAGPIESAEVDTVLGVDWAEWWPPHALWLPGKNGSALLLSRETAWSESESQWLAHWWALWQLAEQAAQNARPARALNLQALGAALAGWRPWQRPSRRGWIIAAVVLAVLLFPVRLTVRAPGELVAREPSVLRATTEGMAQKLNVEPNQAVRTGQLLAVLDDAAAASRLQVARQALATAEAEWRQTLQQALTDTKAKAQLAVVQGRVEEKRTEVAYLSEQMRRTELRAPHDGVVLVDDPGAWAGRTVAAGEPLLRVARPDDQEIEAWLSPADAVDLPTGSRMQLFLASRPTSPVKGELRTYSYEPQPRPEGGLAYRLRGRLAQPSPERLGSRGTVHIDGERVTLVYWVLRRPLAALREATGW